MKKSSVPNNYNNILREYASHGFRVLAIGSKSVSEAEIKEWGREQMEENLVFNGFEVFENPLKPETN
jgi:cation-transporting ATPase 13A3/4/5